MRKVHWLVGVVAALGVSACGGTNTNNNGTTPVSGGTVTVVAKEYSFSPKQISAAAGSSITVVLENQGSMDHSLAFELPGGVVGLQAAVSAGSTGQMNLNVPSAQGSYAFYCPIDGHRALGMTGTLVVGPAQPAGTGGTGWTGGTGGGGGGY